MDKKIERLKTALAGITDGCAYIKLNEDGSLKYVRIDDKKFSNMGKMDDQIIEYSRKLQEALNLAREYQCLEDVPSSYQHL